MTEIASLQIRVDALEAKAATDALNKMAPAAGKAEKSVAKLSTASDEFGKVIGKVAATLAGGAFFQAVIRNTTESENALAQLNATIKSTGGAAGLSSDEMVAMAQGLQKVTTFGDDAIIASEALLATFTKIGKDVFPTATETMLDMSTALKIDLKGAAIQLGKALNDPVNGISALSKAGVSFTEAQKDVIKSLVETGDVAGAQVMILQELQAEFGGSARAARDTFGGAVTALQNAFGDLLEGSGGNLNEAKTAVEGLTTALSDPRVQEAFGSIVSGIFDVTSAIARSLPEMVAFTKWASEELGASSRQGTSQLVHLSDEISTLETLLKNREGDAAWAQWMSSGATEDMREKLVLLKNEYAELSDFEAQKALASQEDAAATVSQSTATAALIPLLKTESELKKSGAEESKAKAAALKAEKTATSDLLKAQAETVRAAEQAQAHKDSQKTLLGSVDPMSGEQQRFAKEMDDLRTLNAAKLLEDQRYLELKSQAEAEHDVRVAALQEENFRRQSAGNELLMASLDQLQVGAKNAFVGIVTGATNGDEAVQQLAGSIVNEAAGAFFEMGVAQVKSIIMGQAAQAAATATSVAAAATTAAAWTPAAAAASIASFGGAAASGLAGMAAAIPAMIGLLSFEGGGFTGSGSRSGGMDGKGGFMAMVHPNETIIDHTKGQSAGGSGVTVNVIESSEKAGQQEKTTNADGSEAVNVFVADIFGDGPRARALQGAFGLKRSGK